MIRINKKSLLSFSVVIVLALVGGLIIYNVSNQEPSVVQTNILDKNPISSEKIGRTEILEDDLGLMNISRVLLSDLKQIVAKEGTGLDVIDLVGRTEIVLNETIKDVDLSDDQLPLVENLYGTLDNMKELAENGACPAQIAETIRPSKRTS